MFKSNSPRSLVTAVLPNSIARQVIEQLVNKEGRAVFTWKARGTLLSDSIWKSFFPSISPVKTMIQMVTPPGETDQLISKIIQAAKLNLQAIGAVYCVPCDHSFIGEKFRDWPASAMDSLHPTDNIQGDMSLIRCIVTAKTSDRISKAAINAGAHGPIVFYSEGRGLRDRLGWLRITKEAQKEVLTVIADNSDVEEIFDAMAKAGELHMPGRGFMYRQNVSKGLFNLPSRISHHHYAANTQQIINAIDHLTGHTHWRDQAAFDVGRGRGAGLSIMNHLAPSLEGQVGITLMARREAIHPIMDLMLDCGVPGLNIHDVRRVTHQTLQEKGTQLLQEYSFIKAITNTETASKLAERIEALNSEELFQDICVTVNEVPRIATYVHQPQNFKKSSA